MKINGQRVQQRIGEALSTLMRAQYQSSGMELDGNTPLNPWFALGAAKASLAHALQALGDERDTDAILIAFETSQTAAPSLAVGEAKEAPASERACDDAGSLLPHGQGEL